MNTAVLATWEELAYRRRIWSELAARCGAPPEWTPAWSIPRWRELGRGRLRAVSVSDDDGTLLGLGLFCESRAPGPKLVTALGRRTDPVVGILIDPGHGADVAGPLVATALGDAPAVMVLEGTDDRSLLADAGSQGLAVSARPHAAARLVGLDELVAENGRGTRATGGAVTWGTGPRAETDALGALTRAMGLEPGPATERSREWSFLVTVLDWFGRDGNLVWPVVTDGGRTVATSAWLVRGDRASLWLRSSVGDTLADVDAAVDRLRSRGVHEVVLRNGEPLGAGLGTPLGAETLLVHNRPGWRRLESVAWRAVQRLE